MIARWLAALAALAAGSAEGAPVESQGQVEIRVVDQQPGRPPLKRMRVDATLRNRAKEPRWFLLPSQLPAEAAGGVDVLEVFELSGHGRAVVGRFLGTGGFQAVLVPAGGELTLHGLQLNYWGEPPTQGVPCEVRVARELSIGGHPARSWFPSDPLSDAKVDAGNGKMIGTHRAEGGKEQPVAAPGAEQLHLTIAPK